LAVARAALEAGLPSEAADLLRLSGTARMPGDLEAGAQVVARLAALPGPLRKLALCLTLAGL
jgi:hypothetical protein